MKLSPINRAKWIFTFQMVIFIHEIFAQRGSKPTLQDLLTLCNAYDVFNCQWLHQNALNDMIVVPKDLEDAKLVRFSPVQGDGVWTWRDPSGQLTWNGADRFENEKLQFEAPFNYDAKRDANSFSSWGGKRARMPRDDTPNGKRPTAFSNWGGKRTQKFFNWGGKRSIDTNRIAEQTSVDSSEHNVMKRSAGNPPQQNSLREKQTCTTNDNRSAEELFKDFIDWSRKQPDRKKASMNRKMFGISVLRGSDDLSRRADTFFQWGGKRNAKNN